jgi:peptidoglycan hydrolase-like protein with peptidoglycan-binding domain
MSNTIKKISSIGLSMTTAVWLSGAAMVLPVASAATVEELQAQINALLAQIQQLQQRLAQQVPVAPTYDFKRDLTVGSKGDDVKALQQFLNAKGYKVADTGAGSPGNETTYFGSLTKAALAKYQAAVGISPSVGYFGPKTRAYIATLAVVPVAPVAPVEPVAPVVPVGLTLALAADNPASAGVPQGATGVPFLKFTVAGKGTLDSLTFKRVGIGAPANFVSGGINLWDGDTRLTSGRSISSITHEVSFINLNLAVDGTKTLTLTADIATGAAAGNVNAFNLISATGTPTPTGALTGNSMTVIGQAVGAVTIADAAGLPAAPRIGQVNALISDFSLAASATEDIAVNRLVLTQAGSIARANLSNFVLKQAGNTLATASAISARDLVVFNLVTPFVIEKGQSRIFEVYADIAGGARANDTIRLYVDASADIYAVGRTYGYGVAVTNNFTTGDSLTLIGGQVTITFNGPAAGDLAVRGQDLTVLDFNIASQNNIEIRRMSFFASTTAVGGDEAFNDFKVSDATTGRVLTSAVNITTATASVAFTDIINISAGSTNRFKVTVDVSGPGWASNENIRVALVPFGGTDIRNLDNNTNVAVADIVPTTGITGNLMSVRAVSVESSLAGAPASRTVVAGASNVGLVAFNFRAIAGDVRINSLKVTADHISGSGGEATLRNDLQSIALYVGGTRISDIKSFVADGAVSSATFSNLGLAIKAGETKTVLVQADSVATNATDTAVYRAYIAALGTDVGITDAEGNTVSAGTGVLNTTVQMTIGTATIQATRVINTETEAGLVMANGERTLAAYDFFAANADIDVKKIKIGVGPTPATSTASVALIEEVSQIKIYDGASLIATGNLIGSGADAGRVKFDAGTGKLFTVSANTTKQIVVKGVLANIDATTAATVSNINAYVHNEDFEAVAGTMATTILGGAPSIGMEKRMYKTIPTITVDTAAGTLVAGIQTVLRFTVTAGANEDLEWKKIQFTGAISNATTSAGVSLMSGGTSIGLAATSTFPAISTGTGTGVIIVTTPERITKGTSKTYDIRLTMSAVGTGSASFSTNLSLIETGYAGPGTVTGVAGDAAGTNSFVWSDFSVLPHSETSADWHNGFRVKTLPSDARILSKS